MVLEIEAKMAVTSHEATRHALQNQGARREGSVLETNRVFDSGDRRLLAAGKGLRVRTAHDLSSSALATTLTAKGPQLAGPLKSREEAELQVNDPDAAARLLRILGFEQVFSFQKRRETWDFNGCLVELDEVPRLGFFVEIEGPSEPIVLRTRDLLGLSSARLVQQGYIALLLADLRNRGDRSAEVNF